MAAVKGRMERFTLPVGLEFPKSVFDVSIAFDAHLQATRAIEYLPIPTGFLELDEILGGGLHPEALMLVGGPPGAGKTIFALQVARNIAAMHDAFACVVCFEHSEVQLYQRLLCMESALGDSPDDGITLDDIRAVMGEQNANLQLLLDTSLSAREAWSRLVMYWERLFLVKGHPTKTTLNVLEMYLTHLQARGKRVVLFVDYLQKVPVPYTGVELSPEKQIRIVTEGLKNLALAHRVPIVAIAASDTEGLKNERVQFQDLWGGSSVQYEPDVAVMLNRGVGNEIVMSLEKNRMGATASNARFELGGAQFALYPIESDQRII